MFPQDFNKFVDGAKKTIDGVITAAQDANKKVDNALTQLHKADAIIQKVNMVADDFVKKISGDMSWSTEKNYTVGLLKGWRATMYSRATLDGKLMPDPAAHGKVSVGINYATSNPRRQGNIFDIFLEPSVKVKQSKGGGDGGGKGGGGGGEQADGDEKGGGDGGGKDGGDGGGKSYKVEFDPPLKELMPMMRSSTWVVIGVCIRVCMRGDKLSEHPIH